MSKLSGYGKMVMCPYNKCWIRASKFQYHLMRCEKQHPEIQLETCPFDITHRFRPEEKDAHIEECPSRENFDRYVYSVSTNNANKTSDSEPKATERKTWDDDEDSSGSAPAEPTPRPRPTPPKFNDEEDWDHYNTPTYDPQQYAMNAKVLRSPSSLMTPSERRRFDDAERKRLSQLERRPQ